MTKEDKDILLRLLQQHKELGISEQIDYQKFYPDSLISNSVALSDMEPLLLSAIFANLLSSAIWNLMEVIRTEHIARNNRNNHLIIYARQ